MSKYDYFEIKDKMTELEFTRDLSNYLSNAKYEVDHALSYNRGVLDEDAEFKMKLRAVYRELDELGNVVRKAYGKEYNKFVNDLAERK